MQAGIILREQDKTEGIKTIAKLLSRVARLYQIPHWSEVASVELAEWTYETYKYEEPETVVDCLANPPATSGKTWRLTPDTITEWMAKAIDRACEKRERAVHQHRLAERGIGELPNVDYEALRKRIQSEGVPNDRSENRRKGFDKEEYQRQKAKYLKERAPLIQGKNHFTEEDLTPKTTTEK